MLVLHALALDEEWLLESSSQEDRDIPPQGKVKEEGALSSAGETQQRTFVFRMTLMNVVIIWEAEDDGKRWIIQSPLSASILIAVLWVSVPAIFASPAASLLLFSEPGLGRCWVMVWVASPPSFLIGNPLKYIYYTLEIHTSPENVLSGFLMT